MTAASTESTTDLAVSGMTCASCVAHVGRALRKVPGVADAQVNLATERAHVVHAPGVSHEALLQAVEGAGYEASVVTGSTAIEDEDALRRDAQLRRKRTLLIFAIVCTAPVVALGMLPIDFGGKDWVMLALTALVWLVVGSEFHRGAIAALRHGTTNMDTLVSLGSTAALAYSVYATFAAQPSYYETAAAIITLVYAGKYLETAARGRSNRAIRALLDLRPPIARLRRNDGTIESIPVERVANGDELLVPPSERIPVDGTIIEGHSSIDASMLTGEPIPVAAAPGDKVFQGTLNGNGALVMRAQTVGAGTTLARIVQAVQRAQGSTPAVQRLADKAAAIFVPAILSIAAFTFIGWVLTHHPASAAFSAAVAVLVVACPCALGLATPAAITVAVGAAAKRGVLFRDAQAIERLARVRVVLFDKTGTLTIGRPEVLAIHPYGDASEDQVLAYAAALEQSSTHPLADAIVRAARERGIAIPQAQAVSSESGKGMRGVVGGTHVLAGSERYLLENEVELTGARDEGATRVLVARNASALGELHVGDAVRPEAKTAIDRLHMLGVVVKIVSGDASAPTQELAQLLHADGYFARVLPEDKAAVVAGERTPSSAVAFVGDGINDAPALAAADVGFAMGAGSEIAIETAQAAILSNDPAAVPQAIVLSRATVRTIVQNVFWAFAYNAILIPLAVFGIVHPILAAAAMGASSLFVVGNSLLLQRRR